MSPEIIESAKRLVAYLRASLHRDLPRNLIDSPWVRLGNGWFAQVFYHMDHPDLVLKVSGPAGFGEFPGLAERSLHSKGLAHCTFHDTPKLLKDGWTEFVKIVQKYPDTSYFPKFHAIQEYKSLTWAIMDRYDPDIYSRKFRQFKNEAKSILTSTEGEIPEHLNYPGLTDPGWLALRDIAKELDIQVDVHLGNIMLDPEQKDFICTDPLAAIKSTAA